MNVVNIQLGIGMLVIMIVILYTYIRISYGFWFYQPVFHLYDIYSYMFPCGIVEYDMPKYTKFTNLQDISMYSVNELLDTNNYKWKNFVHFIARQYHKTDTSYFLPREKHVTPYFTNHTHPCFISFYYDSLILEDIKEKTMIPTKKIVSVMTSRPMEIIFNRSYRRDKMSVYYIDYLCVHADYRKRGIAPEIIQTHYYSQRRKNGIIHANLFKREGELTGIVPLCLYTSHLYPLSYDLMHGSLPPNINVIECTKSTLFYLSDFMKDNASLFDINICCEVSNILDLINTGNYLIYFILDQDEECSRQIRGCIILKRTRVFVEKNKEMLSCIASMKEPALSDDLFYDAFRCVLSKIKIHFSYLMIENISHNNYLINKMRSHDQQEMVVTPMAYFFHNFIYNTLPANKVIIVGT